MNVPFQFDLRHLLDGKFTGISTEFPPSVIQVKGILKGRIKGRHFALQKMYRSLPMVVIHTDGTPEYMGDYIEREYERKVTGTIYHPPMYYFGRMEKSGVIKGKWMLKNKLIAFTDGYGIRYPKATGTFAIKLNADQDK